MSITLDDLFTLFEEVEKSGLLTEAKMQKLAVSYDGIPEIPITELPWAQMESNDEAVKVSRMQIQQFLDNISGEDLSDKIRSINEVMSGDPEALQTKFSNLSGGSAIASTLSYLVFLKTLTNLISNFNASSAGFSFEAFLGVLLGGGQIATGKGTIADLTDKSGTPISLKLYQEKSVKAGGSWSDLVKDLSRPPYKMQYVVVTKTLEGSGSSLAGSLRFYRFDLTLDNIVELMYNTGKNRELIMVPESLFSNKDLLDLELPRLPDKEEKKEKFDQIFDDGLKGESWAEEFKQAFEHEEYNNKMGKELLTLYKSGLPRSNNKFFNMVKATIEEITGQELSVEEALEKAQKINEVIKRYHAFLSDLTAKRNEVLRQVGGDYVEQAGGMTVAKYYDTLTAEEKAKFLFLTYGFSEIKQFDLIRSTIYDINNKTSKQDILPEGQSEPTIGAIAIGRENIQATMNRLGQLINQNVFVIFENLKALTQNLQAYFAEGLVNDERAETAITSAGRISRKTKDVKQNK